MKLQPIVYVTDMDSAVEFYTALGLQLSPRGKSEMWTPLHDSHGAVMALHNTSELPANPSNHISVSFVTDDSLESLVKTCQEKGIQLYQEIADEVFGRSIIVHAPDNLLIQINEYDKSLIGG